MPTLELELGWVDAHVGVGLMPTLDNGEYRLPSICVNAWRHVCTQDGVGCNDFRERCGILKRTDGGDTWERVEVHEMHVTHQYGGA